MTTEDDRIDEYTDGEEYDRENGLSGPDLDYYLDLAREIGGPGLDLACGTGFLTIPFARLELAMTGVDRAPAMLDAARRKGAGLPIRWLEADCRALDLRARFRLITLTGNAFQEFLTNDDQAGLLGSVRRHLAPDGVFAFETRAPVHRDLVAAAALGGAWSAEAPWKVYRDEEGREVAVTTAQRYDALRQTLAYRIYHRWQEDGREMVKTEGTVLRFVYPREMEALLGYHGLAIRDAYGDWDRRPLAGHSTRMIYVCTPRG